MRKFILISLFIHILTLSLIFTAGKSEEAEDQTVEFTMEENGGSGESEEESSIQIVEHDPEEENNAKGYYWGLGITVLHGPEGSFVVQTHGGYCGEYAGLRSGDLITHVNGRSAGENDIIKGDGPEKLFLRILRDGKQIGITVERCKVYF